MVGRLQSDAKQGCCLWPPPWAGKDAIQAARRLGERLQVCKPTHRWVVGVPFVLIPVRRPPHICQPLHAGSGSFHSEGRRLVEIATNDEFPPLHKLCENASQVPRLLRPGLRVVDESIRAAVRRQVYVGKHGRPAVDRHFDDERTFHRPEAECGRPDDGMSTQDGQVVRPSHTPEGLWPPHTDDVQHVSGHFLKRHDVDLRGKQDTKNHRCPLERAQLGIIVVGVEEHIPGCHAKRSRPG
mmetsp:Transcript_27635/g.72843  ORF Transcript_27635/g.72843 Transcript_27635/m.72843 type:complete len:240 (-) Transcript_27635:355-1074(-)